MMYKISVWVFFCGWVAPVLAQAADLSQNFPKPELIKVWSDRGNTTGEKLESFARADLNCPEKALYPSHPQESTKEYVIHLSGTYDQGKVRGDDHDLCVIGQKDFSGPAPACLKVTTAEHFVQSDLYMDRCGNYYRGFWEKNFLAKDETFGDLLALGRVVYAKEDGEFLESEDGPTYALAAKDFLFLTPATKEEIKKIAANRAKAIGAEGFQFNEKTFLFEKVN